MAEWHVTPDYIVNNWTDELFNLMVDKYVERRQQETQATPETGEQKVSDKMLFAQASNLIKVVKK